MDVTVGGMNPYGSGECNEKTREHVAPLVVRITFVVADEWSTDDTVAALASIDDVRVEPQARNRGHGPTALAAYRAGLGLEPNLLVHVGDPPICSVCSPRPRCSGGRWPCFRAEHSWFSSD